MTGLSHTVAGEPHPQQSDMYFGGSASVSVLWNINARILLQTDVVYAVYSEIRRHEIQNFPFDPLGGFVLNNNSEKLELKLIDEYHQVSVPILLNVYFNDSKWSWFAQAGVSAHIFIAHYASSIPDEGLDLERSRTKNPDTQMGENPFNRFTLSAQAGFGVDYNPSQRFKLRIAPFFEHFITNMLNLDNDHRLLPYGAGVMFGAYWRM